MKQNEFREKKTPEKNASGKKTRRFKLRRKSDSEGSQTLVQIMNGDFLKREFVINNLGFLFFIMLLLILMVSKGYYVSQLSTDIKKTEEELAQITADYIESKARLEESTRRSELIRKLGPLGLRETVNPTKVIRKTDKK
jgi:hypothetical protein